MTHKTRVARMLATYHLVTFCDLTLILTSLNYISVLMQYLSYTYVNTLREFELFAGDLTDPRAQNVKSCI